MAKAVLEPVLLSRGKEVALAADCTFQRKVWERKASGKKRTVS